MPNVTIDIFYGGVRYEKCPVCTAYIEIIIPILPVYLLFGFVIT